MIQNKMITSLEYKFFLLLRLRRQGKRRFLRRACLKSCKPIIFKLVMLNSFSFNLIKNLAVIDLGILF